MNTNMNTKDWRIRVLFTLLIGLMAGTHSMGAQFQPTGNAVQWRDTLYVRIADSTFAENAIIFSLQMKRPNANWNKDAVMGDMDFYFTYDETSFIGAAAPQFVSLMPEVDAPGAARKNLVQISTMFHANRFLIATRGDNSNALESGKYTFKVGEWVTLCRVKVPMSHVDRNPGIVWDQIATGAMTAGGNPIILKLDGNVDKNPTPTVKAKSLAVNPTFACQGDEVWLYVRDALTSGTDPKFTWSDSIVGGTWNTLGEYNAVSSVKTGHSTLGGYDYEIRGAGDTLVIKNAPGKVDGMLFKCRLYDYSLSAGMTVDTIVNLRDSLWGYFATANPEASAPKFGMSSKVDTVLKCPGSAANLRLYVFGPTKAEMQNQNEFGTYLTACYRYVDEDGNPRRDTIKNIRRVQLANNTRLPGTFTPGSAIATEVFEYSGTINHTGKIWLESIETEFCKNGGSFALYDTVFIKEVAGDISYNLSDLTVNVNASVDLDTAMTVVKPYTITLKNPSSLLGYVDGAADDIGGVFQYWAANTAGTDTVCYTYKTESCEMKAFRNVNIVEYNYLTMKVLLEGVYMGLNEKGLDTMLCEYAKAESYNEQIFPRNNKTRLVSPYDEKCTLDNSIKKITDLKVQGTICDWVYIKLREAELKDGVYVPSMNHIDSVSAFLLQNGDVCGINGKMLQFKGIGKQKVFIEIEHRNHLKIMSKVAVELPVDMSGLMGKYVLDCTDANVIYYGDISLKIIKGKNCLIAGDINDDGSITMGDKNILGNNMAKVQYEYDINQDGAIAIQDKNIMSTNDGIYTRVP